MTVNNASENAGWAYVAEEVGFLLAPAGLNYSTPGTTEWIYTGDFRIAVPGRADLKLSATGTTIAFNSTGLQGHEESLRLTYSSWQRGAANRGLRPEPLELPESDLLQRAKLGITHSEASWALPLLTETAAGLSALRFAPEYHTGKSAAEYLYLSDILENGMTLLCVQQAA
jgi:hypothetical protein